MIGNVHVTISIHDIRASCVYFCQKGLFLDNTENKFVS